MLIQTVNIMTVTDRSKGTDPDIIALQKKLAEDVERKRLQREKDRSK